MRKFAYIVVLMASTALMASSSLLTAAELEMGLIEVPSSAAPTEVKRWEQLMQATQVNLELQQKVYRLLLAYQALKSESTASDNSDKLFERAQYALELQQMIEEHHLEALFSKEFLQELKLFGRVGSKRGIPQP